MYFFDINISGEFYQYELARDPFVFIDFSLRYKLSMFFNYLIESCRKNFNYAMICFFHKSKSLNLFSLSL